MESSLTITALDDGVWNVTDAEGEVGTITATSSGYQFCAQDVWLTSGEMQQIAAHMATLEAA